MNLKIGSSALLFVIFGTSISVHAQTSAGPLTTACQLNVSSAYAVGDEEPVKQDRSFTFAQATTTTQKGVEVATPNLLLTSEQLREVVLGTGPLATQILKGNMSFMGLFMSKNSQGQQLNNSSITVHGADGQLQSTAVGINTKESQALYNLESDNEWHSFSLKCVTK